MSISHTNLQISAVRSLGPALHEEDDGRLVHEPTKASPTLVRWVIGLGLLERGDVAGKPVSAGLIPFAVMAVRAGATAPTIHAKGVWPCIWGERG